MLISLVLLFAFLTLWSHLRWWQARQQVEQSRQALALATADPELGVFHADENGRLLYVNSTLLRWLNLPLQSLSGRPWQELLPKPVQAEVAQAFASSTDATFTYSLLAPDACTNKDFSELRLDRLLDASGHLQGWIGFLQNPPKERETQHLKELAGVIFEATSDAIVFFDRKRRVVAANSAFERLVNQPVDELLGQRLIYPQLQEPGIRLLDLVRAMRQDGHWQGDMECLLPNQQRRMLSWTVDAIHNAHGKIVEFTAIVSDVTHHYQALREMRLQAHHDFLTGILNRAGLEARFQVTRDFAERDGKQLAVALLDLDGFKPINDEHGHLAGDLVLQEVARRLSKSLRSYDQVARLGGDEFVVVFFDVKNTDQTLLYLGQKLLQALTPPILLPGKSEPIEVGVSIGLSRCPQNGRCLEQLLDVADKAMYQAKRQGKGSCLIAEPCAGEQLA